MEKFIQSRVAGEGLKSVAGNFQGRFVKFLLAVFLGLGGGFSTARAQEKGIEYGNNPAVGRYYDVRGIKM